MVIKPKVRGFVCVTAHPKGCAAHVKEQIDYIKSKPAVEGAPKKVLVIGSSTGYGLSSRIAAAFGGGADTFGVYFERPASNGRPASAGMYNTIAFEEAAKAAGYYAEGVNGDAFSPDLKKEVIERLKKEMGPIDCVIYSLAAPRRTDPMDGQTYKSVLKPVGTETFQAKTVDTDKHTVQEVAIEPASDEEIKATIKVMGGEDWSLWMDALKEADLLAEGCTTVAYSYIGPEVTWPVYKEGTIGQAKKHLETTAKELQNKLADINGRAYVSVNKAVVTQASSAIPVVPLYISLLYKLMLAKGNHEGCIEQIYRLFTDRLFGGADPQLDDVGRIRIDDWEMGSGIQELIESIWPEITTENLREITNYELYSEEFLKLFGFGLPGVDYDEDIDV